MTENTATNIKLSPDGKAFEADCGGSIASLKLRDQSKDIVDFYSTYVPVECRGSGIGAKLVIAGLDWAKANNKRVIPSCPFVGKVVNDHPDYRAIIAD